MLSLIALPAHIALGASPETARRPCSPLSSAPELTAAYLQLAWTECDPAENPIDPFWLDPDASARAKSPQPRQKPPDTSAKECKSFPYGNGQLELPGGCVSTAVWTSIPRGGIHELSCRRLRYFPDILKLFFPDRDLYGHVNFGVFSLTGKVQFVEKASPDQDYNLALFTNAPGAALTTNNPQTQDKRPFIELEFFAPESVDVFQSPWWAGLRDRVGQGRKEQPSWKSGRDYLGDADGYAVGLLGLDCTHGCASELHPLYAIALRPGSPFEGTGERWVFFARNSGTEGFCSNGNQIDLGLEYLALLLRPASGTPNGYDLTSFKVLRHPADASVQWKLFPAAEGAVLLVRFPPGDSRSQLLEGELVLQWR